MNLGRRILCSLWFILPIAILVLGFLPTAKRQEYIKPSIKSKPYHSLVQGAFHGYIDPDGKLITPTSKFGPPVVTLVLRNFDRWIIDQAYYNPSLLNNLLTIEQLTYYDTTNQDPELREIESKKDEYQDIRRRHRAWHRQQRAALVITLAGHAFESLTPYEHTGSSESIGEDTWEYLVFKLTPSAAEMSAWDELIRTYGIRSQVPVTVTLPGIGYLPTEVNRPGEYSVKFWIYLVATRRILVATAASVAIVLLLFTLAWTTDVLRGRATTSNKRSPWSLSRIVLAWWVVLCVLAYLWIWSMTSNYNNLSGSAPILLGINGATLLFAAYTDANRAQASHQSVLNPVSPNRQFILDLISENGSPEISRVQMLGWNLIMGCVFLWEVVATWTMPTFDANIMTLLGISSTAYVGFKMAGASTSPSPPPVAPTPPTPPVQTPNVPA